MKPNLFQFEFILLLLLTVAQFQIVPGHPREALLAQLLRPDERRQEVRIPKRIVGVCVVKIIFVPAHSLFPLPAITKNKNSKNLNLESKRKI